MHLDPEGRTIEYESDGTPTYEDALLSLGTIPDIVLILYHGESLPQDKPIKEDEATSERQKNDIQKHRTFHPGRGRKIMSIGVFW